MITLQPTSYECIKPWIADLIRRSHNHDNIPEKAELLGIYSDNTLAGYYIVTGYSDGDLEINQGYLSKEFRHKRLPALAMQLLEHKARQAGFRRVVLASSRTLKAYTKFMQDLGYRPERIVYFKELQHGRRS